MTDLRYINLNPNDPAFVAGFKLVDDAVRTADDSDHGSPLWHGWALRAAFWAGVIWQRERGTENVEHADSSHCSLDRELVERLRRHLMSFQDEGMEGEGWKSPELIADINALVDALGLPESFRW